VRTWDHEIRSCAHDAAHPTRLFCLMFYHSTNFEHTYGMNGSSFFSMSFVPLNQVWNVHLPSFSNCIQLAQVLWWFVINWYYQVLMTKAVLSNTYAARTTSGLVCWPWRAMPVLAGNSVLAESAQEFWFSFSTRADCAQHYPCRRSSSAPICIASHRSIGPFLFLFLQLSMSWPHGFEARTAPLTEDHSSDHGNSFYILSFQKRAPSVNYCVQVSASIL
jgi:hypothetical protein